MRRTRIVEYIEMTTVRSLQPALCTNDQARTMAQRGPMGLGQQGRWSLAVCAVT